MARIDYWNVGQQIASILKAAIPRAVVIVEEEITFNEGDVIGIYLDAAQAPEDLQTLSAGSRLRQYITFKIWCWHFGFGKDRAVAHQNRDNLIGEAQIALMGNHNLNNTVNTSWIINIEFLSGPEPTDRGFVAGASIDLIVDATAVV